MMVFIFRYGFSLLARLTVLERLRTGARDTMLSDEATPRNKGKYSVFIVPWIQCAARFRSLAILLPLFYPRTTLVLLRSFWTFAICHPFVKRKKKNGSRERNNSLSRFGLLVSPPMYRKVVIGL
jgi:hypothetical protein